MTLLHCLTNSKLYVSAANDIRVLHYYLIFRISNFLLHDESLSYAICTTYYIRLSNNHTFFWLYLINKNSGAKVIDPLHQLKMCSRISRTFIRQSHEWVGEHYSRKTFKEFKDVQPSTCTTKFLSNCWTIVTHTHDYSRTLKKNFSSQLRLIKKKQQEWLI